MQKTLTIKLIPRHLHILSSVFVLAGVMAAERLPYFLRVSEFDV